MNQKKCRHKTVSVFIIPDEKYLHFIPRDKTDVAINERKDMWPASKQENITWEWSQPRSKKETRVSNNSKITFTTIISSLYS